VQPDLQPPGRKDLGVELWKTISPEVLEASFSTTQEMDKLFRSKRLDSQIF
jgi:hypothetical protein